MPWIDCQKITSALNNQTVDIVSKYNKKLNPFNQRQPIDPVCLAIITNPSDPPSESYLKTITSTAEHIGIEVVDLMNCGRSVHGVLDLRTTPSKTPRHQNVDGNDFDDDVNHVSCTARACIEIIKSITEIVHKDVVIIGYGKKVGKPLSYLLMREHAGSVTLTHRYTEDLRYHTRRGEIVISAAGKEKLIEKHMIRPDAVVIDVGISKSDGGIVGDVDPAVAEKAHLTPVPGGVGPVTTALMLHNVALAAIGKF